MDTGVITPITLTKAEKTELESILAEGHEALKSFTNDQYPKVCKLRDAYKTNRENVPAEAHAWLERLIALEQRVLEAYILVAAPICQAFDITYPDRQGQSLEDLMQIAAIQINNAMYEYSGVHSMCNFVYWCVKRKLIDEFRKESKMKRKMYLLEAEHEENIPARPENDNGYEAKLQAIQTAKLIPEHRRLLDAFMAGTTMREIAAAMINPKTGRPYSHQRIGQIMSEIFGQIRSTYAQAA